MTTLKEWTVDSVGEPGQVRVERTEDEVIVHWVCGATRHFKPADLKRALDLFNIVMANNGAGDLWYGDGDSDHRHYSARLDDGNFMADERAHDGAYKVPWGEFSKALRAAIPKPRIRKPKS